MFLRYLYYSITFVFIHSHHVSCVHKWLIWFHAVLHWFNSLMMLQCGPKHAGIYIYIYIYIYTRCNRRKGPNFGRVFLRSNYTDITQNTYIQSSMVMEIVAREVQNFDSYYSLIDYQIHIETGRNMWVL